MVGYDECCSRIGSSTDRARPFERPLRFPQCPLGARVLEIHATHPDRA